MAHNRQRTGTYKIRNGVWQIGKIGARGGRKRGVSGTQKDVLRWFIALVAVLPMQ